MNALALYISSVRVHLPSPFLSASPCLRLSGELRGQQHGNALRHVRLAHSLETSSLLQLSSRLSRATTILLSRLFLNLREVSLDPTTTDDSHASSLQFASALGPLGHSLADERGDLTEHEEEDSDNIVDEAIPETVHSDGTMVFETPETEETGFLAKDRLSTVIEEVV